MSGGKARAHAKVNPPRCGSGRSAAALSLARLQAMTRFDEKASHCFIGQERTVDQKLSGASAAVAKNVATRTDTERLSR